MSGHCENCGCRVYDGACTNCEEAIYIVEQYHELNMDLPSLDSKLMAEHREAEVRRNSRNKLNT